MIQDDEFESFLTHAIEHDEQTRSLEAASRRIQQEVASALHVAGFVPLVRDEQRLLVVHDQARVLADADPDASTDTYDRYVDALIRAEASKEEFAIAKIILAAAQLEDMQPSESQETIAELKRILYAQLVVSYSYNPDNPILDVVNTYLPGGMVDPDAPDMMSYYAHAMQQSESASFQALQTYAELHGLLTSHGLTEHDARWSEAYNSLCFMSLEVRLYRAGSLGEANLAEKLEELSHSLPVEIRRSIIDYFLRLPTDTDHT